MESLLSSALQKTKQERKTAKRGGGFYFYVAKINKN